jgi:hypothetical protein
VELQRAAAYVRMCGKSNLSQADWVHNESVEQACREGPCKEHLWLC